MFEFLGLQSRKGGAILLVVVCLGLVSCSAIPGLAESTATLVEPTATATESPTPLPTETPTHTATATETSTPTETPTETPTAGPLEGALYYFFTAANADGPIGCGEELVSFSTGIVGSGDAITDVRIALERLFGAGVQYQFGAYNPLYGSSLIITSVQYEEEFDEIVVRTTGNLNRGEKGCDWDRIRLVVRATVRGASGGESVEVRFNHHAFNDYVSSDR
jgi:hypothetical protein